MKPYRLVFVYVVALVPSVAHSQTKPVPSFQATYGKLPLSFEANQGQTDPQVKFTSRGPGYSLFLTDSAAVLVLAKPDPSAAKAAAKTPEVPSKLSGGSTEKAHPATADVIRMELAGASPDLQVTGADQLPGTANYFIGNDPKKFHSNVATFSKVKYSAVYPGVDLVYYGNQRQLEYDFVVAPNADPKPIKLHFIGAEKLKLNANGDLSVIAKDGEIIFHKPEVYQRVTTSVNQPTNGVTGERESVDGKFAVLADNTVGFKVGSYDSNRELVIDPKLGYSTYLGGSNGEEAEGIAIDDAGNAYVFGYTNSANLPVTVGALQTTIPNSTSSAFVTKINATGTALGYSTYLGGADESGASGIAVDGNGSAYVLGSAGPDFPVTAGALQTTAKNGGTYITKLDPAGSALVYSTFLSDSNVATTLGGIALNSTGDVYITGSTNSKYFPVTEGAFQESQGDAEDVCFVSRLNSAGSALVYSTYLGGKGGSSSSNCTGIAVDGYDKAYVTGDALGPGFPITSGAFQTNRTSTDSTVFLTKLNASGSALEYSTFLGGSADNYAYGIAVDSARSAYVVGSTTSPDFPVTPGAYQTNFPNGRYTNFITKFDPTGSPLVYSTFFGSDGNTVADSIAVDNSGHAFLTGTTTDPKFPTTPGVAQKSLGGYGDAFLTRLNIAGSQLSYSTYFGGALSDSGQAVAVDRAGNAYLWGMAGSKNLIVSADAFQKVNNGYYDDFVAKFSFSNAAYTSTQISTSGSSEPTGTSVTFTATVAPVSGTRTPAGDVSFRIDGSPYIHVPLDAAGVAVYSTNSLAAGQHTITAAYLGTKNYALASDGFAPSSASLIQTITRP